MNSLFVLSLLLSLGFALSSKDQLQFLTEKKTGVQTPALASVTENAPSQGWRFDYD